MKAAIYTQYGPPEVLQIQEVSKPIPKKNEILIKIHATAVNSGDWRLRKADPFAARLFFGLFKPRIQILGIVFSGEVASVGDEVKKFKVGDEVFGHADLKCGCYASYKCLSENASIALKPSNISHTEAAIIPFGAVTALHFLKKAKLKPGQKVIVIGASGAVGSAAVQLAKVFGAQVTGVCSSANAEWVKAMGADKVIDYHKEDFTQNGEIYDVIFDAVNGIDLRKSVHSLSPQGTMILSASNFTDMFQSFWMGLGSKQKYLSGVTSHSSAAIVFLKELIESGQYQPIMDRTYPLEQIVEAHTYVEQGHKKGNVAITI